MPLATAWQKFFGLFCQRTAQTGGKLANARLLASVTGVAVHENALDPALTASLGGFAAGHKRIAAQFAPIASEKAVRLAQNMQVGPRCIPVGIQL
jgi:hypothetical protein